MNKGYEQKMKYIWFLKYENMLILFERKMNKLKLQNTFYHL